jgi:hypothetical protein
MAVKEKRQIRRTTFAKRLRVRPSDRLVQRFVDFPTSRNVTKRDIYFQTQLSGYFNGMHLFVTFPFDNETDPLQTDYLAEVIRVEALGDCRFGVAVRLIQTI